MNPREEIKDIAPKLSQWKHKEGYSVPSDYFENFSESMINRVQKTGELEPYFQSLPDQVMNKIKQEEKVKVVPIRSYYKYGAVAAMLILTGTILWTSMSVESMAPTYATVVETEELEYIIDEIPIEDIFDSEFIEDELFDELLAVEEDQHYTDDLIEDLLLDVDDELLEDFL